ncbi:hypothetical protein [Arthrobacter sp. RCC_34]|uniref:hypothetical protein n=1 Tax=Arthrobacter sp. RCC_34 TaxID=3239230 RepID=UPI0035232DE6
MSRLDDRLAAAIKAAGVKPADSELAPTKKNYNQRLSDCIALALAEELRDRGMKEARPSGPGEAGVSGAERRLAGGIGAKKVDVSWATEESGLIFAVSVKSIMFRDGKSNNFQKNLTNRRGDMLVEAVTLHRRFPYAVLAAFFILDAAAATDGTARRNSTFENAIPRLRLFTRRPDPAGREEQFERFYLALVDANQFQPSLRIFEVNDGETEINLDTALDDLIELIGERNFDLYGGTDGQITKL